MSLANFYKPAPKRVQRWAAALKGVGGVLAVSTMATELRWLAALGLVLCAVGEGLEKLTAKGSPPPPAE
jgi:uncharacterized membrane protein YhhN